MTEVRRAPAPLNRLPSLDGFRALAITAVLIQHSCGKPGWPAQLNTRLFGAVGGVGVRLFFVISGFLITYLMLREFAVRGSFSLRDFYLRRALRIFPIYFLYVAIVGIAAALGVVEVEPLDWLKAITFTVDFGGAGPLLGHLWSLGVEEKFYLLWPPIAAAIGLQNTRRLVMALLLVMIACPVLRVYEDHYCSSPLLNAVLFSHHSFFTIADGLAIGCLAGIAWSRRRKAVYDGCSRFFWSLCIVGLCLVIAPLCFWTVSALAALRPLQDTLQCCGFAILVLTGVSCPDRSISRALNFGVMSSVGVISYSLYMWMPLFEIPTGDRASFLPWPYGFPHWIIALCVVATISYRCIEQPVLSLKRFLRSST
jgi:peptidoglycan/LPS O-acetylase OafA/YrhL